MIEIAHDMLDEDEAKRYIGKSTEGEAAAHQASIVLNHAVLALETMVDAIEHKKLPTCKGVKPHTKKCKETAEEAADNTYRMIISNAKPIIIDTSSSGSESDSDSVVETLEAKLITINPRTAICVPVASSSCAGSSSFQAEKQAKKDPNGKSKKQRDAGKRTTSEVAEALAHVLCATDKRHRTLGTSPGTYSEAGGDRKMEGNDGK